MSRGPRQAKSVEEGVVLALFDIANQLYKLGDAVAAGAGLTTQQWLMIVQRPSTVLVQLSKRRFFKMWACTLTSFIIILLMVFLKARPPWLHS